MNSDDKKIQGLLRAYAQPPQNEAFVQKVMRSIRQEKRTPQAGWLSWIPRLVWVGAAAAAAVLLSLHPHPPAEIAGEDPAIFYVAGLIETPTEEPDPETEQLIESYFL